MLTAPPSHRYIPAMPDLLEQPPATPKAKRGFFTAENARAYALKSHAADSARCRPTEPTANADDPAVIPADRDYSFTERRLMRVRMQLEKLDALAAVARNSKRLKELADATTRLSEQERILAGRPLPGSRRPASDRGNARAMIELRPLLADEPAQVQVVAPAGPVGSEYDDPPGYVREPIIEPADTTTGSVQPAT